MESNNVLLAGLERVGLMFNPLRALATGRAEALARFERDTGWILAGDIQVLTGKLERLLTAVHALVETVRSYASQDSDALPDLGKIQSVWAALVDALPGAERAFLDVTNLASEADLGQQLLRDLRDLLILNDLKRRSPAVYAVLSALGVVQDMLVPPLFNASGTMVRRGVFRPCLLPARLGELLCDPGTYLTQLYVPTAAPFDDEAARRFISRVCAQLEPLARLAGASLDTHASPIPKALLPDLAVLLGRDSLLPEDRDAYERLFRSANLLWKLSGPPATSLGARFEVLPEGVTGASGLTGPGVDVLLAGTLAAKLEKPPWSVEVKVSGDIDVLGIAPQRVKFGRGTPSLTARIDATFRDGKRPLVLGASTGPRLELGALRMTAHAALGPRDELDAGFGVALDDLALLVAPDKSDAFLTSVLPPLSIRLDAALAWSRSKGLRLAGEAGLKARIPIRLRIPPALEIPHVDLEASVKGSELRASAQARVAVALGPLALSVDGLGATLTLDIPAEQHRPRAGFEIAAPSGIALALDIPGVVEGFGSLAIDTAAGRYAGAAGLTTPWFSAAAIGVITTKHPWSFFISMGAVFKPAIQLGYGFMLAGVGGLFAVNRELDPPGLLSALRAGELRSVLFPRADEPLDHIEEILGLVEAIFPVKKGSFVFGPMVCIDWGPGPIISAVLGVMVSLPEPLRIALIGQLSVKLPPSAAKGETLKPILDLNMDVLGLIDFGTGLFALDGRLYDSTLLQKFKLSGDIAFRAYFGSRPSFLFCVGGFHPSFEPPADIGALERMTLSFELKKSQEDPKSETIARFALKSYLALTSNTLQTGARFDFFARLWTFTIAGGAGFNAILWYKPFRIEFDADVAVTVSLGSRRLMGVDLALHATGPHPWHLWGDASFDFLGLEVSKSFDLTFSSGSGYKGELERAPVAALLKERLADGRAWDVRPARSRPLVLRAAAETEVRLVSPDAALECRTQVVPLRRTIERFGADVPETPRDRGPFSVKDLVISTAGKQIPVTPRIEDEWFSPAKYTNLDDEARLRAQSFEPMPGVVVVDSGVVHGTSVSVDDLWEDWKSVTDAEDGFRLVRMEG